MTLLAAALLLAPLVPSEEPSGRPVSFAGMSDLQIWKWLRSNRFYHAANVYQCRGLSRTAASERLKRALGLSFEPRHVAIAARLAGKLPKGEDDALVTIGYKTTPAYCRRIRYVVSDILRGTAELERRLGMQ